MYLITAKARRHVVKKIFTGKVRACAVELNFQSFARPLSIDQRAEDGGASRLSTEIDHRNTRLDGSAEVGGKLETRPLYEVKNVKQDTISRLFLGLLFS